MNEQMAVAETIDETLGKAWHPSIRLATNDDGPRIGELVASMMENVDLGFIDWSEVFPFWLVAEVEGRVAGALQVTLGKPMGRVELLAVDKGLPHRAKAAVVKALMLQGLGTLQQSGAQAVLGMVPFEMKGWKKLLKKRGGVVAFSGNTMVKRL